MVAEIITVYLLIRLISSVTVKCLTLNGNNFILGGKHFFYSGFWKLGSLTIHQSWNVSAVIRWTAIGQSAASFMTSRWGEILNEPFWHWIRHNKNNLKKGHSSEILRVCQHAVQSNTKPLSVESMRWRLTSSVWTEVLPTHRTSEQRVTSRGRRRASAQLEDGSQVRLFDFFCFLFSFVTMRTLTFKYMLDS